MEFDRRDADAKLSALAIKYGAEAKSNGGGLRYGCDYDSYVLVGEKLGYYASIAIRNPRSHRPAYFAITRMAKGRKVLDDQVPLTEWHLAEGLFGACVEIAKLKNRARTIGLIDQRGLLWTDD